MAEMLTEEFLQSVPFRDRSAFAFYYGQTSAEHLPVSPEYTWDQFAKLGYAPFLETEDSNLASLDETASGLIPNYYERVDDIPPMLSAFEGRTAEAIYHQIDSGNAAIINTSHPSLASPILVARSLVEALGSDVRKQIYIVYGLLPTVFKYEIAGKALSPVSIARSLGNTMLTAAISPSNETNDHIVSYWQTAQRANFKELFEEVTAPQGPVNQGAIVLLCVTGQRIKEGPVLRPDGTLTYLRGLDIWNVGVEDDLLGPEITSKVWMQTDPIPIHVEKDVDVHESNARTCELACHGTKTLQYETRVECKKRLFASRRKKVEGTNTLHLG